MTMIICSAVSFFLGVFFGVITLAFLKGASDGDRAYEKAIKPCPTKFTTPYDDKLIALGVKEQFDNNVLEAKKDAAWAIVNSPLLEKSDNFRAYMAAAFNWNSTPEGAIFWYKISLK